MYLGDDAEEYTRKLEINVKLSNSLLNASGGGDNFKNIFWDLVEQVPEYGVWRTMFMEENPDRIIQVVDHDNDGVLCILNLKCTVWSGAMRSGRCPNIMFWNTTV